jgi:histidyl-tRNA synthetase
LCGDCRRRLRENPLRVLDCKEEKCQPVKSQAPQMIDHLCEECNGHFKEVLEFLDELELPYRLNPYLVRGLDYYTKTVFEVFSESTKKEEGSEEVVITKSALLGGGRYDNLVKMIGGHDTPGCGAAMGIERIVELMKQSQIKPKSSVKQPEVFIAQLGSLGKRKGLKLFEEFARLNIPVAESFGRDSLKSQLRIADKLEVRYTLILGQQEALAGTIIIREMKSGKQETVKLEKVVKDVASKLRK